MEIENQRYNSQEIETKFKNPINLIEESFSHFIHINSIEKNYISREKFLEWNFIKDLEERKGINLLNNLTEIPFLTDFLSSQNLKHGQLIKFNCMIQNVFSNEIYVGGFFSKKKGEFCLNKFYEYEETNAIYEDNHIMPDGEQDLNEISDIERGILTERLVLYCVPIPGMTPILQKNLNFSQSSLSNLRKKKIIVYDYENSSYKVNEEILIVGMAYERENEIIIHSWKLKIDFIPSLINFSGLNENSSKVDEDLFTARNFIFNFFTNVFNGDELVSEYLIMFLVSQIFSRVGTILIGKLSINLINLRVDIKDPKTTQTAHFFNYLQEFIRLISNFTITYTPTINIMNKEFLYPRFDTETDELKQGLFQTVKNTFLLINETELKEGKLDNLGCKNFNTIKNLIDFQCINYEYPYNNLEINHDSQILIYTNKIKSLFHSSQILEIPFNINDDEPITETQGTQSINIIDNENSISECQRLLNNLNIDNENFNHEKVYQINLLRYWYNYTKYNETLINNFKISQEVTEKIQKNFIEGKEMTGDDLDTCIKLARLYAITFGRAELNFQDYIHVKDLENKRKMRLRSINYKK